MSRGFVPILITSLFALVQSAVGQIYSASILHPLTPPSGSTNTFVEDTISGQAVGVGGAGGIQHALLWNGASTSIDLNPTDLAGVITSDAVGVGGGQQVGDGSGTFSGGADHALLWNGTAASAVDLAPVNLNGITDSAANATDGIHQVGQGFIGNTNVAHALLWGGTSASVVDLNPANIGITYSIANAISGNQQVGYGNGSTNLGDHALLWNGSAASAVDLNPSPPTGPVESRALGTDGSQQVGEDFTSAGGPSVISHAMLWNGTAASAVDLQPTDLSGYLDTTALDTNGSVQVGYGFGSGTGNNSHAMLWFGTSDSAVDIQALLPSSGTWVSSAAYSVDSSGNVFGTADGTFNNVTGTFAVEWSPVPEPASLSLVAIAGFGLLGRRRPKSI